MLFNLSQFGLLKVSGNEAKKLLQGQLTCDVDELSSKQSVFAALCNPQGRIISLFYLCLFADNYFLLMPRSMVALTQSALKKYAVFYKTELREMSDEFTIIGSENLPIPADAKMAAFTLLHDNSRAILFGEHAVMRNIKEDLTRQTSPQLSWHYFDIKAGIPSIYPETSGKLLPHEINLDILGAINFKKGCYTGQEIIARMHYLGKLKKRLYSAHIASGESVSGGLDIYVNGNHETPEIAGTLIDAAFVDHQQQSVLLVTEEKNIKNNHLYLLLKNEKVFLSFSMK